MDNKPKIYESPDKGKNVYERDFGAEPSTRVLKIIDDNYIMNKVGVDYGRVPVCREVSTKED